MDGDIAISIARKSFSLSFEDAQRLLPQEPLDARGVYARPMVGLGLMGARTFLAPLVMLEGRIAFDNACP